MSCDDEQTSYYRMRAEHIAISLEAVLDEYEEQHPSTAPCFHDVLTALRAVMPQ